MKKSFYDQFGKEIDKEAKKYEAHSEKKPLEFQRCNHKKAKMVNNELRCSCGVAWSGPNLEELLKNLKVL